MRHGTVTVQCFAERIRGLEGEIVRAPPLLTSVRCTAVYILHEILSLLGEHTSRCHRVYIHKILTHKNLFIYIFYTLTGASHLTVRV